MTITITREPHRTRFGQTWLYTVHGPTSASAPDGRYSGTSIGWARRIAKSIANGQQIHERF